MSDQRPRRTLRTSTKLIPTPVPAVTPHKRVGVSRQEKNVPTSSKKTPQTAPPARKSAGGGRRGRKPKVAAVSKRPECFNHKNSTTKYNDYHYGSDFEDDSDEVEQESEDEQSLEDSYENESCPDETLDPLISGDIEDIDSSSHSNLPIWLNPEIQVEQLIIPQSSDDLILDNKELVFPLVSIYESIIKFYKSLRITPFKFEDFCACLSSNESSVLLVEIHVQILKSILREDEAMNVTYGPLEYKDSIQASFYFVDHITWVDGLITYFKTDKTLAKYIELIQNNNYPFCGPEIRAKIINVLLNIYLSTNAARDTLAFDDLSHEDHCRICGRLGELICCETCTSVAHLGCINPPIIDPPEEWKCSTCTKQLVPGLSDCLREEDKTSIRHEKLGNDRHGRTYWFLVRRILVESLDGNSAWYYTTPNQLAELMSCLSETYESELIQNINYNKSDILSQMAITEKLTNQCNTQHRKTYIEFENSQLIQLQTSRELINKQNELEKVKILDEILLKKQLEEEEKLKQEEEVKLKSELEKKRIREERLERRNKKKYGDDFESFEDFLDESNQDMDYDHSSDASPEQKKVNGDPDNDHQENSTEEQAAIANPDAVNESAEISSTKENHSEELAETIVENSVDSASKKVDSPVRTSDKPDAQSKLVEKLATIPRSPAQTQIERQIEQLKAELVDTEKERMTRLKASGLYKLGQEANFKNYVNFYSQDSQALSKLQHNEERDKKRYMSHKFSLTQLSDFKWIGQYITIQNVINTIRMSLIAFENNIPLALMHVNWSVLRKSWVQSVNNCKSINDFRNVIIMFRGCLRDCLFNNIWMDGVGHFKLMKMNPLERDEMKKTEKKLKKFKDDEDDRFKVIHPFVKYTIPCKHQLWKQKGEEYRLHGQFGWIWMRSTRRTNQKSNFKKYNLVNGPYKYVIQVKSDNKIKTMLIDPTVYVKLMAKRNMSLENKTHDVKIKVESPENESIHGTPVKPEKIESETPVSDPTTVKTETPETEVDAVKGIMQGILNQLELEEAESKSASRVKNTQPPKKYNTELLNVSLGIVSANRILYPKIAHRINILDDLLNHRTKIQLQEENEFLRKSGVEYKFVETVENYKCYCYGCGKGKPCYSPICSLVTNLPRKETSSKMFLKKVKPDADKKNIVYPLISKYRMNNKPNPFILQNVELMKLARTGGRYSTPAGFSVNNKTNMLWNYQCGKPAFYKTWEYNLLNSLNLGSIGMGIRILYSCIRWDDIQVKPPNTNEGRNQITTDMEIITSEVLKHRVQGQFMNKIQYLRRKEIVPIDLPKTVREITPSRLGLRKRKRTELQDKTEPTVVEEWVNENQIEIWEIRYYGDRVDRPKQEMLRRYDNNTPNTRTKSGIILHKPEKLDNSVIPVSRSTAVSALEPLEPVQRIVHLSKRDNHVKINTVNKVQIPTASQQLQQQQAQQKSVALLDKHGTQGNVLPANHTSVPAQPSQQTISQPNQSMAASIAIQQVQDKNHQAKPTTGGNRIFLSKTKDITPKPVAARKTPQAQLAPQQQLHILQQSSAAKQSPATTPQQQQPQQRLQIVRTSDGKLQLKGLLPGQHAYQTADGKIHVITSAAPEDGVKPEPGQLGAASIATDSQLAVDTPVTTPTSASQQVALASTQANKQPIVASSTVPGVNQQIIMATTPSGSKQQVLISSATPTKTVKQAGKQPQIIMAAPPGGTKQQIVMLNQGTKPQFVMAASPGNPQQFVLTTAPGNKQIVMAPLNKQILTPQGIVTSPAQFIQQPLINISSQAMKTVINNSIPQLQQPARLNSPSIIKGKQSPILISKNPTPGNQQQIFVNQNQILVANPQQQMNVTANQGNKVIYNDGSKTYMINSGALNEYQLKSLANQFQQKRLLIKQEPGSSNIPSSSMGQILTTSTGQQIFTSSANASQIINSNGQLIMVTPNGTGQSLAPLTVGQQIITSQGSFGVGNQIVTAVAPDPQQQNLATATTSLDKPTFSSMPMKQMPTMGGQSNIATSGRFVPKIVSSPSPSIINRQIVTNPAQLAAKLNQQIRMASAQVMQSAPEMGRQLPAGHGQQILTSPTMKPTNLPISIVSPTKPKARNQIITPLGTSPSVFTSDNLPLVTMTPAKLSNAASPARSPIAITPTRLVAPFPGTPTPSLSPIVISPPSGTPGSFTSTPKLPALQQVPNVAFQISPSQPTSLYQDFIPSTGLLSSTQISGQQVTPGTVVTSAPTRQTQLLLTSPASSSQFTPVTTATSTTNSKITAQYFGTPSGSRIVIQGGNKFSPEELLQIQTQLKKQIALEAEKTQLADSYSVEPNDSLSSVDESINAVIQNTKAKASKNRKKNKSAKEKSLDNPSQTYSSLTSQPHVDQPLTESSKPNKKTLKLQQMNRPKMLAALTKNREALKKEIEYKRNNMENSLKIKIQKEIMEEKLALEKSKALLETSSRGVKRKSTSHLGFGKKRARGKTNSEYAKWSCTCNTPRDDSRSYILCYKCTNWYHCECVGVSRAMTEDYTCDKCQAEDKVYCLCKQPYDDTLFYICCDKCQDWFHGRCIGVLQSESAKISEYICPNCDPNTELNAPNLKPLNSDDFILLQKLIKQMIVHKSAWAFIKPVDVKDAPNYYKVIKEPMDLQTVEVRVTEKVYSKLRDFVGDVTKIFDNCRYFNGERTEFYKLANNLELFFKEKIILLRKKLIQSRL